MCYISKDVKVMTEDVDGGWNEMECWMERVAAGECEQDAIDCT